MAATTTTPAAGGGKTDKPGADAPRERGLGAYLRGVREELKPPRTQWPSRSELIQLTKVTLVIIAVVAAYCGALDSLLGLVTNNLFGRS